MIGEKKMKRIYEIQKQMQDKFRKVPKEGQLIEYLGKNFLVYPGVFWPSEDSKAIVKNYIINKGEEVLDLCTGSGVIAVFSAINGAKRVLATDINPDAVKCAEKNAERHGFNSVIEVRFSDMFTSIKPQEKFDVITINPPFTPHSASDFAERTVWDENLTVQNKFFEGVKQHLKKNGRIYMSQAKFGAVESMKEKARKSGFSVKCIGKNVIDDDRVFYAFELKLI